MLFPINHLSTASKGSRSCRLITNSSQRLSTVVNHLNTKSGYRPLPTSVCDCVSSGSELTWHFIYLLLQRMIFIINIIWNEKAARADLRWWTPSFSPELSNVTITGIKVMFLFSFCHYFILFFILALIGHTSGSASPPSQSHHFAYS